MNNQYATVEHKSNPSPMDKKKFVIEDPAKIKKNFNPWLHLLAGGIAGINGALLTSPLDVVKTRLQSDMYNARYKQLDHTNSTKRIFSYAKLHIFDTFSILNEVRKTEGWTALYRGLGPYLVGVIPARAINFFSYSNGKYYLSNYFNDGKESSWIHLLSAASAGIITSTCTNPIWLIKTRLQLDKKKSSDKNYVRLYKNSWDCLSKTVRQEGIKGLYKGLSASYLGVTESTLQWLLYEKMKMIINQRELYRQRQQIPTSRMDSFLEWVAKSGAAGLAKLAASLIAYPHEVVRTRLRQAPLENGKPKYTGLYNCFKVILQTEGVSAFYGGLTPHLLKTVPNSIVMFGTWEFIVKYFS